MNTQQLIERIQKLKVERNAIVLAHNYQLPEIQDIADFTGDSLELAIKAAEVEEKVIVFCGVSFMAETAKVLSPDKIVILPDESAGCPMADMINAEELRKLKAKNPNAKVLCYVNSSAEVKAESDLCCTSSNAAKLVEHAFNKEQEVIFVPDKWLARFVGDKLGRTFITHDGYCPIHAQIPPEEIIALKAKYPEAKVIVHPECTKEIDALADAVLATGQMSNYAKNSSANTFIVGTEEGMLHRLRKENPNKQFILASPKAICPDMKKITLEKLAQTLETMSPQVELPQEIIVKAEKSIKNMIEISKKIM